MKKTELEHVGLFLIGAALLISSIALVIVAMKM